jgi:hypothetical protein
MEKIYGEKKLSEEETTALYARKMKKAAQILFFQRHRRPGVKGWELRKILGKDFFKILDLLDVELEKLGLKVKIVYEEEEPPKSPSIEQLERARFYITLDNPLTVTDTTMSGWRIDDVAALAVTVAYIVSKQGKAPRKEVEQLLKQKFPKWRVDLNLDRYIRWGYINQDEKDILYLDWRSKAEIDLKTLVNLILEKEHE